MNYRVTGERFAGTERCAYSLNREYRTLDAARKKMVCEAAREIRRLCDPIQPPSTYEQIAAFFLQKLPDSGSVITPNSVTIRIGRNRSTYRITEHDEPITQSK